MVCGVNLGILVACLVQLEYVRCFWETQGKGFKKQNANTYDPFTQDRLRQASFSSGFDQSLNQGLPASSYSKVAPKMPKNALSRVHYVRSRANLQGLKGDALQRWPLQGSEITSVSSVSKYGSPETTDFTAVRDLPVQGSQGPKLRMSRGSALQSSRENDAFRKPHMTAVNAQADLKDTAKTSATVRGKLVHSSKRHSSNQRERFPFNPVQVNQYQSGRQLYDPQSYSGSRPQSNFNQKTPNDKDASTVTYRVSDKYGGSLIIRLKNEDHSEKVRPLETRRTPLQTVSYHNQGQKLPKRIWRKVKPKSNMRPLD